MSEFINIDDYNAHIREHRLDQIIDLEDEILVQSQTRAIGFVKGYISTRFDAEAIFEQTGTNRDPVVLGYTIDIALYYLWRRVAPRKIPAYVQQAYDDAKEWLLGVQAGEVVPVGLPPSTSEHAGVIKYGSNPKRNNHI